MRARGLILFTAEDGEVRRENDLRHGVMRGGRELAPDGSVAKGFPPRSSAHSAVDKTPVRDASQRRCPKNIPNINHVRDASRASAAVIAVASTGVRRNDRRRCGYNRATYRRPKSRDHDSTVRPDSVHQVSSRHASASTALGSDAAGCGFLLIVSQKAAVGCARGRIPGMRVTRHGATTDALPPHTNVSDAKNSERI